MMHVKHTTPNLITNPTWNIFYSLPIWAMNGPQLFYFDITIIEA